MKHISEVLDELQSALVAARDSEISTAAEVLTQYITDHQDKAAYRRVDRQVTRLALAWDRMIGRLEKWQAEALKIEASCESFYGD